MPICNHAREAPPERGAAAALGAVLLGPHKAPLVPAPIHTASTSEPAARWSDQRGRLYRQHARSEYSQRQRHLTPAGQRLNRRPRYWEPRKPLAGTGKPRRSGAVASPFPHLGNHLALVPAQRLDRQPGLPQIGLGHGDRRPGQRLGHAVVVPEHLGGGRPWSALGFRGQGASGLRISDCLPTSTCRRSSRRRRRCSPPA